MLCNIQQSTLAAKKQNAFQSILHKSTSQVGIIGISHTATPPSVPTRTEGSCLDQERAGNLARDFSVLAVGRWERDKSFRHGLAGL